MITIRQRKRPPAAVAAAAIRSALGTLVRFTAAAILLGTPTAAPAVPGPPPGGAALPPHINSPGSTGSTLSS